MFTGIVEEVGTLVRCEESGLVIQARHVLTDLEVKESIAVDGICLTVTERGESWFRVDTMPETVRRTRLSQHLQMDRTHEGSSSPSLAFADPLAGEAATRPGTLAHETFYPDATVNLERSLRADGRMGGHMVQGHVEATAPVLALKPDGIGLDVTIGLPAQLASFLVAKGFIAINGVSLTIVECQADRFSISLIPYTREHTNLGNLRVGSLLNLESDIVGRYVVQLLGNYTQAQPARLTSAEASASI